MNLPSSIEIKESRNGEGLFAKKLMKKGSVVFHFEGRIDDDAHTNAESLQLDGGKFLESTMFFDDFLNHSCEPNCYVEWNSLNLVANKDIKKGEELTYDYCTSDWDDANLLEDHSFKCNCGSKECRGLMKGFKYLTATERRSKNFSRLS